MAKASRGFTLVEVLIAMAITALVAGLAYSGIATVVTGAEQLRSVGQRTQALNRALDLLDRDLLQFVARPVRDEFGDWQPALSGGDLAPYALSLTRGGWHNSLNRPRSELQRVHYYVQDSTLWRAYSPVLDRASDVDLASARLLDGVQSIEWRFLEGLDSLQVDRDLRVDRRGWVDSWIGDAGAPTLVAPPVALEMTLRLDDVGEIRRLYVLPAP